jgi:guanylate kinase
MNSARGKLVVISSPSGGGKTTVTRRILESHPQDAARVVTATTRRMRPGEKEGQDYIFMSPEDFEATAARGGFLEWAEVHGNRYGTPRDQVEELRRQGKTVLLVIDVQGAEAVRRTVKDAVTVFISPPGESIEEQQKVLQARLEKRAQDSQEAIEQRLRNAALEIARRNEFEYEVQNSDLEETVAKVTGYIFPKS